MRVGILYSRVRAEEKLLFEEFTQRGAEFDLLDDRRLVFDISGGEDSVQYDEYDVIVERCIHHGRALVSLRILNDRGIPTVNSVQVADVCGDKLQTTSALTAAGVAAHEGRFHSGECAGCHGGTRISRGDEAFYRIVGAAVEQDQRP